MKLSPFRMPAKPGANKPLRSFSELATECKLTMPQLRGHMAARLKCGGNGVVSLCAALATVVLARRAGIE